MYVCMYVSVHIQIGNISVCVYALCYMCMYFLCIYLYRQIDMHIHMYMYT